VPGINGINGYAGTALREFGSLLILLRDDSFSDADMTRSLLAGEWIRMLSSPGHGLACWMENSAALPAIPESVATVNTWADACALAERDTDPRILLLSTSQAFADPEIIARAPLPGADWAGSPWNLGYEKVVQGLGTSQQES
jgi:hypothetical protein